MNEINREKFEAWLFAQPRDRTYKYWDTSNCILCQFIRETTNHQNPSAGGTYMHLTGHTGPQIMLPNWLCDSEKIIGAYSPTFGQVQDNYRKRFPDFEPAPEIAAENKPQEARP